VNKISVLAFFTVVGFVLSAVNGNSLFGQTKNIVEIKKVHVGDIDIAYKMFGSGDPIVLINDYSAPLEFWDSTLLKKLATNHTVILFDNRGIGNTTSGNMTFTIPQFAEDTSSILDALKIKRADVMGWSMGGFISQELALKHPDKVRKLIIYASACGGTESVPPTQDVLKIISDQSGTSLDKIKRSIPLLFPAEWRTENPNYLQNLPITTEKISDETLNLQTQAIMNWAGTCDRLNMISQPTLIVVGTKDILTVPSNSLFMTEKVPGAWLVQMRDGGHGLMFQYPEEFSNVILNFLKS